MYMHVYFNKIFIFSYIFVNINVYIYFSLGSYFILFHSILPEALLYLITAHIIYKRLENLFCYCLYYTKPHSCVGFSFIAWILASVSTEMCIQMNFWFCFWDDYFCLSTGAWFSCQWPFLWRVFVTITKASPTWSDFCNV